VNGSVESLGLFPNNVMLVDDNDQVIGILQMGVGGTTDCFPFHVCSP